MTSFIDIKYSTEHPGVARVESAIDASLDLSRQVRHGLSGTRGLSKLLLSAMVAATMVVAYEVMDSVAEGHLLVMWIALWAVAFAALALFAGAARDLAARLGAGMDAWSRSLAEARSDQRLWAAAKQDHRLMADLQGAVLREEARIEVAKETPEAPLTPAMRAARALRVGSPMARNSYDHCF
jgi:hypothetical protein